MKDDNGRVFLQVVAGTTDTTSPCLMLKTDSGSYLWDCGEGTQRVSSEHRFKMHKVNSVFLTRLELSNLGGLAGMLLTVSDSNVPRVKLCGPRGIANALVSMRYFFKRPDLHLHVTELEEPLKSGAVYKDDMLNVTPVIVTPSVQLDDETAERRRDECKRRRVEAAAVATESNNSDVPWWVASRPQEDGRVAKSSVPLKFGKLEVTSARNAELAAVTATKTTPVPDPTSVACSYICELPPRRGKFLVHKAIELGIKPGPLMGKLARGEVVLSDKGQEVLPSQCLERPEAPPLFAVVSCPTTDHVAPLISHPLFHAYLTGNEAVSSSDRDGSNHDMRPSVSAGQHHVPEPKMRCVVHFVPGEIFNSAKYQAWVMRFGKDVQHIVLNRDSCAHRDVFASSSGIRHRLGLVDREVFLGAAAAEQTQPSCSENGNVADVKVKCTTVGEEEDRKHVVTASNIAGGDIRLRYYLLPHKSAGLDNTEVPPPFDPALCRADATSNAPFVQSIRNLDKKTPLFPSEVSSAGDQALDAGGKGTEVVFLGTGAAMPSKYRNVSAVLLLMPEDEEEKELKVKQNQYKGGHGVSSSGCTEKRGAFHGTTNTASTKESFNSLKRVRPGRSGHASSSSRCRRRGVLMDAGEGTMGQLRRRFGREGAETVVNDLEMVWISHMHADHHLGLLRLLCTRSSNEPKLLVAGPSPLKQFLEECAALDWELGEKYEFVDNDRMLHPSAILECAKTEQQGSEPPSNATAAANPQKPVLSQPFKRAAIPNALARMLTRTGFHSAGTVPVDHCFKAYGLVLDHQNGWKFVYSGDTEPCEALVLAGNGATVLVHEATLQDGMNAHRILLTHFSQRYPKIPLTLPTDGKSRVVLAYDLMGLNFEQLKWAPRLLPVMKALFEAPDALSDDEETEISTCACSASSAGMASKVQSCDFLDK